MSKLLPPLVGIWMLCLLGGANGQPGDQATESYCIGCYPQTELINLVNHERAIAGVNPVASSADLIIIAEMRSREMARKNITEHEPLSEREEDQRHVIDSLGFRCCWENIHNSVYETPDDMITRTAG